MTFKNAVGKADSMNRQCKLVLIVWLCITVWACSGAQQASRTTWTAQPERLNVDNQLFAATMTPQKGPYPYFAFFHLTLSNKSDADLIIDWNASQYLFNGSPQGALVFEGIDPKQIKAGTVPSETVAPGATFARNVMPLRLIAWSPVNEKSPGSRAITPGMFPDGRNGIRLAVGHDNARMTIPLSVEIARQVQP
jgi:hypothetical protein